MLYQGSTVQIENKYREYNWLRESFSPLTIIMSSYLYTIGFEGNLLRKTEPTTPRYNGRVSSVVRDLESCRFTQTMLQLH